jgi:hypothetical protein
MLLTDEFRINEVMLQFQCMVQLVRDQLTRVDNPRFESAHITFQS